MQDCQNCYNAPMNLYYQVFPEGVSIDEARHSPLVIIPGLFGSTSNWRTVAKRLSESRPVIVIDQRNHGRSDHADSNSYTDMVADLFEFIELHQLQHIHLAGHSMGGKVAMLFALQYPKMLSSLIVLDIAPRTYTHSHAPFLSALLEIDLSDLKSRSEADRALQTAIPDVATRLFLLQSLTGSPNNYRWRINIQVLHDYMDEIVGFANVDSQSSVDTLVLGGDKSTYINESDIVSIQRLFPDSSYTTIANAGHWLHAEQPEQVIAEMETFLSGK